MLRTRSGTPDYLIMFCLIFLVVFGLVMLASSSSYLGQAKFGDSLFYLKHQIWYGLLPGLIGFFLAYFFYYRHWEKLAIILLLVNIVFLILIFTPLGLQAGGADRWLYLGPLRFQPAELLKLTFVVYLAAWLSGRLERRKTFWQGYVPFLILSGIVSALVVLQPATTIVVILMLTALTVYFVSGAKLKYIFGTILLGALILATIVYITPYRWQRIQSFLNQTANPQAGGYHLNQAKIAIGSGGLTGVGYGESTTKIGYLPEPIGDSIFAVIGEELGFIGSMGLITVFFVLILKIFLLAKKSRDHFARFLLVGFGTLIALQVFINIGAISGLLPLTGVPLPFISYGGTALATFLTISGVIANISKYN
ncbi:MAG: Uncharacterized protein G01um10143_442 [Parcubacteria group bacterium Gr01-1014_3]|nr:MAG: Uncharacterized protein G01um10143_442 [Parcubacteria group bacterium Gr01-1014_3]